MEKEWYLYILRCADDTFYTGIAVDVERRFRAHVRGKGAKYTRGRGPLVICYRECCGNHSDALKREYYVKSLSRQEKERLIFQAHADAKEDPEKSACCESIPKSE